MRHQVAIALLLIVLAAAGWTACEKFDDLRFNISSAADFKILFVGDTSFGESYDGTPQLLKRRGYDYPLEKLAPVLQDSDYVLANLETPITDIAETPFKDTKPYNHWTHVLHAPATLAKYNIRAFGLANNHTLDYGVPGLQQTLDIFRKNDFEWVGAGMNEAEATKPLVKTFDVKGQPFKMAVIAPFEYSVQYDKQYDFYAAGDKPGAMRLSRKKIMEQIKQIKAQDPNTFVVVFPHWGANYAWKNQRQTKAGRSFIKAGADLVVGHGGHMMQEVELYENKWIVYGLGNFMFLSPGRYKKSKKSVPFSYSAQLILVKKGKGLEKRIRLYPHVCNNRLTRFQPRLLNEKEFAAFHEKLLDKSPLSQKEQKLIRRGQNDIGYFVEFGL